MSDAYTLSAKFEADNSGLMGALESSMKGLEDWGINAEKMTEEGSAFFKKMGIDVDQFAEKLGVSAPMLVGLAAAGVAVYELGEKVFEIGNEFDESFSKIGKATGLVGPDLQAIGDQFTKVMGSGIEQNIDDVAGAFALLEQKLGLTGPALEEMTVAFAQFADVTSQNVTTAVQDVTQIMAKWNIPASQAPELMDQMTKAWQKTGTSISDMTSTLLRSGAVFQDLGLSLTDATAMMAEFGKEGINTRVVASGFTTALDVLSKQPGNVADNFQIAIDKIKSFSDGTQAASYAADIFGKTAGPNLANAIRNSGTAIQDLTSELAHAQGTVKETAEGAQSLGDKWAEFGNKVKANVEPLGEVLIKIAGVVVDVLGAAFTEVSEIFGPVFILLRDTFRDLASIVDATVKTVKALIDGDWAGVWNAGGLAVLNMAKVVLDALSNMANLALAPINIMIDGFNALWTKLGKDAVGHISLSLSAITGLDNAIKAFYDKVNAESEESATILAKNSGQVATSFKTDTDSKIAEETKYRYSHDANFKSFLADLAREKKETDDAAKRTATFWRQVGIVEAQGYAERKLESDASAANQIANDEAVKASNLALAAQITSVTQTMIEGPFAALGKALAEGTDAWDAFEHGAVHALGALVNGIGDQLIAMAAADVVKSVAAALSGSYGAAAGFAAAAAVEFAGGAAAYTAAGALGAYASGTPYSPSGAALLGENGPELVMQPGIHNLAQGSVVLNATDTAKAVGGNKSATFIFNSPKALNPNEAMRAVKRTSREMRFKGNMV